MIPEYELVEPRDLSSALAALQELGPKARPMAGGTDVLLAMRDKGLKAECLVYIGLLPELRGIEETPDGGVSIGAATPLHEVEISPIVHRLCPVLAEAVGQIGSVQVRNRGTLGGNVCNASPSADSAPVLMVLEAQVEIVSTRGNRTIPIESLWVGPGKTSLASGELVRRIVIPPPQPGWFFAYAPWGPRRAMDIPVASAAVALKLTGDGACTEARVALGAVAPTPIRAPQAEATLVGKIGPERLKKAAEDALGHACPIEDVRATFDFRCRLVRAMVKQAVRQALARHRGTGDSKAQGEQTWLSD